MGFINVKMNKEYARYYCDNIREEYLPLEYKGSWTSNQMFNITITMEQFKELKAKGIMVSYMPKVEYKYKKEKREKGNE